MTRSARGSGENAAQPGRAGAEKTADILHDRFPDRGATQRFCAIVASKIVPDLETRPSAEPAETQRQRVEDLVSPSPDGENACLTVLCGQESGRVFELAPGRVILGRAEGVGIALADPGTSRHHASVHSAPLGYVITDLGSSNGLFVNGVRLEHRVLREGDRVQVGPSTVLKFSYQDRLEIELRRRLYESATRDGLTGLHNKTFFIDSLKVAFAHAARKRTPLSVLVLDVDFFKRLNDGQGHLTGDEILRQTATFIQNEVRTEDVLSRFGGDEFVLLMSEAGPERAQHVGDRIRKRVAQHRFELQGDPLHITLSVGGATFADGNHRSPEALFATADAALYDAKRAGRNCTTIRLDPAPPAADTAILPATGTGN